MKFRGLHVSWWIIGIVVAALVVLYPLLKPGFIVTDDGDWMIIRLSAFFQSLREGQFPVRFLGRLNNSYGYPVSNFLYPGFLYIGSVIHLIGFSFVDTVKIIFSGSIIGSAFLIFYLLKKHFSALASFIGTLGFLFSPYLLFDIYKRGSVGEVLAVFAILLVLFTVERNHVWLVPLSVTLLILSHNSLGLLFFLFLLGFFLVRKKVTILLPVCIGAGMATFFWFPALYERTFVMFDSITVSSPEHYFIGWTSVWLLGIVNVIGYMFVLKQYKKLKYGMNKFFLFIFTISIFFALPLSNFLWSLPIMEKIFQFPYRFLSLSIIVGPWFIAQMFTMYQKEKYQKHILFLFALLWLIPLLSQLSQTMVAQKPEGFYTTNEGTTTVSNEYMPRWAKEFPRDRASQRLVFFQGKGKITGKTMSTQKIDAEIVAEEPSIMQLNSIYYPGWGIAIDGQFIPPDYANVYGLMRVPVSAGPHHIIAEFRETIPRFIADGVSVAFGILYLGYTIWIKRKNTGIA